MGNARDFESGDSDYGTIADNTDLSTGDIDFSFAGWINVESLPNFVTFLCKDDASGQREYGFFISNINSKVSFYVGNSSGSFAVPGWATGLSLATWYFVAGGHNATANDAWISVNAGTPVTTSWTTGVKDGTAAFRLGSRGDNSQHFDGILDDWGFWKRDIRSDLSELYNSGSGRDYSYITGGGGGTALPFLTNKRANRMALCGGRQL